AYRRVRAAAGRRRALRASRRLRRFARPAYRNDRRRGRSARGLAEAAGGGSAMSAHTGQPATPDWPPALPLVAILRGLQPERAEAVGRVLFAAGLRVLEVPLNRPGALNAIESLVRIAPPDALVGAGTVTDVDQVGAVAAAGGRLIVAPHFDPNV